MTKTKAIDDAVLKEFLNTHIIGDLIADWRTSRLELDEFIGHAFMSGVKFTVMANGLKENRQ